jgi:hypothetical protein
MYRIVEIIVASSLILVNLIDTDHLPKQEWLRRIERTFGRGAANKPFTTPQPNPPAYSTGISL